MKNLPGCTSQPSSESFRIHLSGSASLEIPEVTRWTNVAVWYWAISRVDALIPVPCVCLSHPPHLQLVTFTPVSDWRDIVGFENLNRPFGFGGYGIVWCAKSSQHRVLPLTPRGILVMVWFSFSRCRFPPLLLKQLLCCYWGTVILSNIFWPADKSPLCECVNDFCKYLCVCRWRKLPEQVAEKYVLRCSVWKSPTDKVQRWVVCSYLQLNKRCGSKCWMWFVALAWCCIGEKSSFITAWPDFFQCPRPV